MTATDIIGNLRMFLNINSVKFQTGERYVYMSNDTLDALSGVFQTLDGALLPYNSNRVGSIYGYAIRIKDDLPFGSVAVGDGKRLIRMDEGDK